MANGLNVRFDLEELDEVRKSAEARRDQLDKARKALIKASLSTFVVDCQIEVLDRVKTAIGDQPEDMFSQIDKETGEILEDD